MSDVDLQHEKQTKELMSWRELKVDYKKLPLNYMSLSKSRLTALVCLTSAAGQYNGMKWKKHRIKGILKAFS